MASKQSEAVTSLCRRDTARGDAIRAAARGLN